MSRYSRSGFTRAEPAGGVGRVRLAWRCRHVVVEVVVITPACPFHLQCPTACFHSDTQSAAQGGTSTLNLFCLKVTAEEEDHFLSHRSDTPN